MNTSCNKDYIYTLTPVLRHVNNLDAGVSYTTYGVRLALDAGDIVFQNPEVCLDVKSLRRRLKLILQSHVPYYQVKDIIDDFSRGG
ncbi:MAG: hypothetical protein LBH17_02810 [Oscillospiraceae bacterium]|jgi:hypothetical protein|nr:hypothetical protein [Oscillospiraceae bacterium]